MGGGPWSPASLRHRALTDLAEIAAAMHSRGRDPHEIEQTLARQVALWRMRGAELPDGAALAVIRQLPGLSDYDPYAGIDPKSLAEGIELPSDTERVYRNRALTTGNWLIRQAGSGSAEAAVRAIENAFLSHLEGRP